MNSDFKNVGDLNSKVFSEVVASRKFYDTDGITPIAGYADEHKQEALYKLKIKSAALRAILLNNVFENLTILNLSMSYLTTFPINLFFLIIKTQLKVS